MKQICFTLNEMLYCIFKNIIKPVINYYMNQQIQLSISGELGEIICVRLFIVNNTNVDSDHTHPKNFIAIHNSLNGDPHNSNKYLDYCYLKNVLNASGNSSGIENGDSNGEFKSKIKNQGLCYFAILWGYDKLKSNYKILSMSQAKGPSSKNLSLIERFTRDEYGFGQIKLHIHWFNKFNHRDDYVILGNDKIVNSNTYIKGQSFNVINYNDGNTCETSYALKGIDESENYQVGYCSYNNEESNYQLVETATFKEYATWMSIHWESIKFKKVRDLVLPGSHDASTYGISRNSIRSPDFKSPSYTPDVIVSKWSKTQNATLYKQLLFGTRYFDLRVAGYPTGADGGNCNELWTIHNMFSVPIIDVLKDIARFMKGKREIIILHWNHLQYLSKEQHLILQNLIKTELNGLMAPRSLGLDVTVEQLEFNPVINIYDDGYNKSKEVALYSNSVSQLENDYIENEPLFWYHKSIVSSYSTKHYHSSESVIKFLENEINTNSHSYSSFWVLQCILTLDSNLKNVLQIAFDSLFHWNNSEINTFLKFIEKLHANNAKTNIIMTDFCTFYPLASYAIKRNTTTTTSSL